MEMDGFATDNNTGKKSRVGINKCNRRIRGSNSIIGAKFQKLAVTFGLTGILAIFALLFAPVVECPRTDVMGTTEYIRIYMVADLIECCK